MLLVGLFRPGHTVKGLSKRLDGIARKRAELNVMREKHRDDVKQAIADRHSTIASINNEIIALGDLV
jgi:hypothetical protein